MAKGTDLKGTKLNKWAYILANIGGALVLFWALWLSSGYIPLRYFEIEVRGESLFKIVFQLVCAGFIFFGAAQMRKGLVKGSILVIIFGALGAGGLLAFVGGILGLIDYYKKRR